MSRKVYEVDVTRDGKFWLIEVPAVKRGTQARKLEELEVMARDLIAIMEDVEPDSFDIDVVVKIPPAALESIQAAHIFRASALEANAAAAAAMRDAARAMAEDGFTHRDIGRLLGVSFQRVHQLVQEAGSEDLLAAVEKSSPVLAALRKATPKSAGVPATKDSPRLASADAANHERSSFALAR